jgi:hypothetical protein
VTQQQKQKDEPRPSEAPKKVETNAPAPSIGRIVRYVTAQGSVRPAIIAEVGNDSTVDIVLFNKSNGAIYIEAVELDPFDGETPGTYHWPVIG